MTKPFVIFFDLRLTVRPPQRPHRDENALGRAKATKKNLAIRLKFVIFDLVKEVPNHKQTT